MIITVQTVECCRSPARFPRDFQSERIEPGACQALRGATGRVRRTQQVNQNQQAAVSCTCWLCSSSDSRCEISENMGKTLPRNPSAMSASPPFVPEAGASAAALSKGGSRLVKVCCTGAAFPQALSMPSSSSSSSPRNMRAAALILHDYFSRAWPRLTPSTLRAAVLLGQCPRAPVLQRGKKCMFICKR